MKKLIAALALSGGLCTSAQVQPGDLMIVAFNSDSPDEFAWVALRDIPAGTVIKFTDSSVSNGHFRWTEHLASGPQQFGLGGPLVWSNSIPLERGVVVRFDTTTTNWSFGDAAGNYPLLSSSGDQLFVYQGVITFNSSQPKGYEGDARSATMLFGVNFANSGWSSRGTANYSEIPFGLSTASLTAVHIGPHDNGYYAGISTGTVAEIRRAIANTNNWITSDFRIPASQWPVRFEILPGVPLVEFY